MVKNHNIAGLLSLLLFSAVAMSMLSSCSEKEEAGEFDNWQERNMHYVDSIANVARANADGTWTVYLSFNLSDSLGTSGKNEYYIYVQKLENGTGESSPQYNDSVRVHYSGRLLPSSTYPEGYNFGKSYSSTTLNELTDVPSLMSVSQNIKGFATALMHMVEGDRWRVIIPYYLGYGESDYSSASIPGYSTLIFDIKLAKIYKYKKETDTSWH